MQSLEKAHAMPNSVTRLGDWFFWLWATLGVETQWFKGLRFKDLDFKDNAWIEKNYVTRKSKHIC